MIKDVIQELREVDGKRPDWNEYLWVNAIDVLEGLKAIEVDPKTFGITQDELDDELLEGLLEDRGWHIGRGDNSYNWTGNISHDITFFTVAPPSVDDSELTTEYSENTYEVMRFHKTGDVRGNYTADIMVKSSTEDMLEDTETFEASFTVEVDGKEFYIDASVWDEGMRVIDADSGDDVGELYAYEIADAKTEIHWMLDYDNIKAQLEELDRFIITRLYNKWGYDIIEQGFSALKDTYRHIG